MAGANGVNRLTRLAFLGAVGSALYALEYVLPLSQLVPGAKPGLGNLATMLALALGGPGDALLLAVVRVMFGHLLMGSFLSVNHALGLSGSLSAALVMLVVGRGEPSRGGLLRAGVAGGIAHSTARVVLAGWLMGQPLGLTDYAYPVLLGAAVGAVVGAATAGCCRRIIEARMGGLANWRSA
jgi:heptaprenyl diphosphate synthase